MNIIPIEKKEEKIGLFIQARTNSKRLPNKVIKKIKGKTLLERCLISLYPLFEHVDITAILAPSWDKGKFDFIKKNFPEIEVLYTEREENAVLKRFTNAIHRFDVNYVIRICSDRVINKWDTQLEMLSYMKENNINYISCEENPLRSTTGEIYKSKALLSLSDTVFLYDWAEKVTEEAKPLEDGYIPYPPIIPSLDMYHKEIMEHISVGFKNQVKVTNNFKERYPYDFSIDTKEDLQIAKNIITKLYEEKHLVDKSRKNNHYIDPNQYMEYYRILVSN